MEEHLPVGVYLGEGSSSPVAGGGSHDGRSLPLRKRTFTQMLLMDNPRDGLESAELDEIGAVYALLLVLLSTTFSFCPEFLSCLSLAAKP
jgi:hypothetical protein